MVREPLNFEDVLPFGKYRGTMVGVALADDPGWFYWAMNNTDLRFVPNVERAIHEGMGEAAG